MGFKEYLTHVMLNNKILGEILLDSQPAQSQLRLAKYLMMTNSKNHTVSPLEMMDCLR